ncbi:MAG: GAF domain-containing protein [Cyclobacteriaceae bacterium]
MKIPVYRNLRMSWKFGTLLTLFAFTALLNFVLIKYFQNQQAYDAAVIDAAGRNRMLTQQIGFFAERVVKGEEEARLALKEAINLHQESLMALKLGGVAPRIANDQILPPTPPHILPALLSAEDQWKEYMKNAQIILQQELLQEITKAELVTDTSGNTYEIELKEKIVNPDVLAALGNIEKDAAEMLKKDNEMVKRYVENSAKKQARLNIALLMILFLNLLMIGVSLYLMQKFLIRPVENIRDVAARLAQGDLSEIIVHQAKDEVGEATRYMAEVTHSLEAKAAFAEKVGKGIFDRDFKAASEVDKLGKSLMSMRDQLAEVAAEEGKRKWASEGISRFADLLRQYQEDLGTLSQQVLSSLVKYLDANQGAIFIVNDDKQEAYLEMTGMYAWGRQKHISKQIKPGEDLLGQAWIEKEAIYLTEVPESYVEISSGIGKASPRSVLIVPLMVNEEVVGMLEMAAFRTYEPYELEFINKVAESIAATFSTARVNHKTRLLLEQSQQQAEELRAQEEEMRQNMEELAATQEEMSRKEKEYLMLIEELQAGQQLSQE